MGKHLLKVWRTSLKGMRNMTNCILLSPEQVLQLTVFIESRNKQQKTTKIIGYQLFAEVNIIYNVIIDMIYRIIIWEARTMSQR